MPETKLQNCLFNPAPFLKKYTQNITINSHAIIFYGYYALNHIPWILL